MAIKWHVNPETGKPGRCTASVRGCDFAKDGKIPPHFESEKDARGAFEKAMEQFTVPSITTKKESEWGYLTEEEFNEVSKNLKDANRQVVEIEKTLEEYTAASEKDYAAEDRGYDEIGDDDGDVFHAERIRKTKDKLAVAIEARDKYRRDNLADMNRYKKRRAALAPLTRAKFENLQAKENDLKKRKDDAALSFKQANLAIENHDDDNFSNKWNAETPYEDLITQFDIAKNESFGASYALDKFNDINGAKMSEFRANNLDREDYAKLRNEENELNERRVDAQKSVDDVEDDLSRAASDEEMFNDVSSRETKEKSEIDLKYVQEKLDKIKTEIKKFEADNRDKIDRHVKEFGEWDWQDDFRFGNKDENWDDD